MFAYKKILALFTMAAIWSGTLSLPGNAQEPTLEPGQQTLQSLKPMIENLGYQPKDLMDAQGKVNRYLLTVASGGANWKVIVEISPNQENVWVYANLATIPDLGQTPRDVLVNMLKANEKMGPSYFAFNEKNKSFYIYNALTNRGVSPRLLRERIENVARHVDIHESLWNPNRWSASPGTGPGPIAVSPEVQRLMNELNSPDELVRLKAAKDLGKLGAAARAAIPALRRLQQDPDEDVRRVAANAIDRIQGAPGPGPGPGPGPEPSTVVGTVWEGTESLAGFGSLKFQFDPNGKAIMFDAKFADRGAVPGSWTQTGNQVKLSFKDCVYEGTITGDTFAGNARFLEGGTTWTFSLTRNTTRAPLALHPGEPERKPR